MAGRVVSDVHTEEALEVGLTLALFEAGLGSDQAWFGSGQSWQALALDGVIRL